MRSSAKRYLVELDFRLLDDTGRHGLVTGIQKVAPVSPIFAGSPAIQASVAALAKKDAVLTQANDTVTTSKRQLKADTAAESTARADIDAEIRTLVTLTQNAAKAPADVTGMGLPYRTPAPTAKLPPAVPAAIDVKIPRRGHGKATVSVHETGKTRQQYAAQWSPDPIGTFSQLGVGHGKSRVVTGASGTKVWVRFATVRGQLQSDWSTPVLVTIP